MPKFRVWFAWPRMHFKQRNYANAYIDADAPTTDDAEDEAVQYANDVWIRHVEAEPFEDSD